MKFFNTWARCAASLGLVALSGAAQAALVDRGGGMVYDTSRNLTWLADMNYAKTSGYDSDGLMSWSAAGTWASGLAHGGYDDWQLASIDALKQLFVTDLGNGGGTSVLDHAGDSAEQLANMALFTQLQSWGYWSGTADATSPDAAWGFFTASGSPVNVSKGLALYAVAVRTGDVAAVVPEPQTLALALLALGATAVLRRRRPEAGRARCF
jgi:MYXO-CTERM domain-containing protein